MDALTPLSQGEQIRAEITGAEFLLVPGTGHRPHLEDPVATAGFIGAFLSP
jgi:pimeloyl-ACP methyl ester carboxylesterase